MLATGHSDKFEGEKPPSVGSVGPGSCYIQDVNRLTAVESPVVLSDLLGDEDLREFAQRYLHLHGVNVAVVDQGGYVSTGNAKAEDILAALAYGDDALEVPGPKPWLRFALQPLLYEGRRLGMIVVGPYCPPGQTDQRRASSEDASHFTVMNSEQAAAIATHAAGCMELLAHHAYARYLTSTIHSAAMEETFAVLSAKNQRLEQAVEHMQQVDRLKSSFLATMSHELRTPLTSVIGYAEMLYEGLAGPVNAEQREYLQTILSKADHLLQLITGLLDASMLESGSMPISREPVALAELVEGVISGMGQQVRERELVFRPVSSPLPRALGDARRIRQVLRHLITNAIKFTGGGARIEIRVCIGSLERHSDGARGLQVVVADSGIGIPPEQLEHIFEPFFQVDSSSTRKDGGTGLGLTLATSYIEAHGGHIWVDSTPGQGSAFTFSVPAVPEELSQSMAANEASGNSHGDATSQGDDTPRPS